MTIESNLAMRKILTSACILTCWLSLPVFTNAQPISRSFELRYFTSDTAANGETDFKGPTAIFNTEQRVTYLQHYADVASRFFNDPALNQQVVSKSEVDSALRRLKPQPLPETRRRISLDEWRWLGYREGQRAEEVSTHAEWQKNSGVTIQDGYLHFSESTTVQKSFSIQPWRFFLKFDLQPAAGETTVALLSEDDQTVAEAVLQPKTIIVRTAEGEIKQPLPEQRDRYELHFEVDLESGRYNLYLSDELVADFVPLLSSQPSSRFRIQGSKGLKVYHIFGQGYRLAEFDEADNHSRDFPFSIENIIDEDFELKPPLEGEGWQTLEYDDQRWNTTTLPYPHGGVRYAGEDLYMRKAVSLDSFERAVLSYETLDPGGEIWVNGRVVEVKHQRTPGEIDLTSFLQPNAKNIIALRIFPNRVKHASRHTATDHHTGWFAGRMHLDFTGNQFLTDVFAYAVQHDPAVCRVEVSARSEEWGLPFHENEDPRDFHGKVRVSLFEWFPTENTTPVAAIEKPIYLNLMYNQKVSLDIPVPDAKLWSVERPFLYKVHTELIDSTGQVLDDWVITTGLRTISQEGGMFTINGQPAMMNGALLFGFRPPLYDVSRNLRAGPKEWLVKEVLMVRKMNGNTLRMSVHNDQEGGINDPRLAEIADQLGLMFQWTTGTWVRKLSPWTLDIASLPQYVKQVRNHPSIVMWQPTNHPLFNSFEDEGKEFLEQVYHHIYPYDPSRLIAPVSNVYLLHAPNDTGTRNRQGEAIEPLAIWNAPMMTIGDMDHATGYGAEWNVLRNYPNPPDFSSDMGWRSATFKGGYIDSEVRAYFDFESEENAAQPNWNLMKGKPYYRLKSYEYEYDEGSIGRQLSEDEWRTSQAWQAFSGFEAYKKKRWLGYDGMVWCPLHGGGNTGTYMKPIIDYYGHAKLGFYALQMVFQDVLAGTHNVDVAIGPSDRIDPVVINMSGSKEVYLDVIVKSLAGEVMDQKSYDLTLSAGRNALSLPAWDYHPPEDGYYVLEYIIRESRRNR